MFPVSLALLLAITKFLSLDIATAAAESSSASRFVYNGFHGAKLNLNGAAEILPNGLLRLTNNSKKQEVGHAFYPTSFPFLNSSFDEPFSFSTSFVFAIVPQYSDLSSEGIAFAVCPSGNLSAVFPSQHFGLFNLTNNGDDTNHIVAVELDTTETREYNDINDNHVGIDVNGLASFAAAPASFALNSSFDSQFQNLSLISGMPMRIWADYDAKNILFNVTLAPLNVKKPSLPLLSSKVNLTSVLLPDMYVGFSSSTGAATGSHYILAWSFAMNDKAEELNLSELPALPTREQEAAVKKTKLWVILLPITIAVLLVSISIITVTMLLKRRRKFAELIEEWETEYGPHRFSYRTLYKATGGFSNDNILGNGGFGEVYKGLLSKSKQEIAVKRISHDSKQGMKEFVAEITSIGRLRHRNLVQLLGYSRRRGMLMLVYDFMPNGSLNNYIYGRVEQTLSWKQRFHIIKGIAAGLLYLHEEWEQVVIHRDIKASNVLLDAEFNGKLGDFGLARLHDRGKIAVTTKVVGTFGYLAPELSRTGNSTTSSDVFAFGAFLLEVACGKRPVELRGCGVAMVLVDWVMEFLRSGELLEARDKRLGEEFVSEEVEMVLRLGLICSHPTATARPGMRQVVQYLEREAPLPEMTAEDFSLFQLASIRNGLIGGVSSLGNR